MCCCFFPKRVNIVFIADRKIIAGMNGYINNFRFKHSNIFKGDVLPFSAKIYGTYYVDILGTPELSYIQYTGLGGHVTAKQLSTGANNLPVVCVVNTAGLIANLMGAAHLKLSSRLLDLETTITEGSTNDVEQLIKGWDSYVDVSNPDYNCKHVVLSVSPSTENGYLFAVTVTFDTYSSIVFVDALGVGMFSYQRSYEPQTTPDHKSGNPIRFCGGAEYTGDMYTMEPRPKCVTSTTSTARHYGRAMITVFKPNIVSVRQKITKCVQHVTHVETYTNFFNQLNNHFQKTRSVRTPPEDCRKWMDSKDACGTFKIRGIAEGGELDYKYYSENPDRCQLTSFASQNNAMSEYKTDPDISYTKK